MSYLIASTLKEALKLLQQGGGSVKVIAGATDLYPAGLAPRMVDIASLPELAGIRLEDGCLQIGAAVTHSEAARSGLLAAGATALAEACAALGSPQIRNIATLGGNVVNGAPAADAAVALTALGATAVYSSAEGSVSEEAVENLYSGYNLCRIDSSKEILLRFIIKAHQPGEGSSFMRLAARKALSLPIANAAASVRLKGGKIIELCLVAAPIGPAPTRLRQTEALLIGMKAEEATWLKAEQSAAAEAEVRGSLLRCSADYRRSLIGVLAAGVLKKAAARAEAGQEEGA